MGTNEEIQGVVWVGVVEDNADPMRRGRVRARVQYLHGDIPSEHLPWVFPSKNNDGTSFVLPGKGKVVNIEFLDGDLGSGVYVGAEHYNINLQNSMAEMSQEEYLEFVAVHYDHATQLYRSSEKGLVIDHEYSNVNLDNDGNIMLNLRDNESQVGIGSVDADQQAVLGNHFMDWMDKFTDALMQGGFIGNLGAPTIANPQLIQVITEYKANRDPLFLSKHVFVVDNDAVKAQKRPYVKQPGDEFAKNDKIVEVAVQESPYVPVDREETGMPDTPKRSNALASSHKDMMGPTEDTVPNSPLIGNYEPGNLPEQGLKKCKSLAKWLNAPSHLLLAEAGDALDALVAAYKAAKFTGKQPLQFTSGYRTNAMQNAAYAKYGAAGASKNPGAHGMGIAVDMWWGVKVKMHENPITCAVGYRHPVYRWFRENGPKFGWYSPELLSDAFNMEEWWHWEYHPGFKHKPHKSLASKYSGEFTDQDISTIKQHGGTYRG